VGGTGGPASLILAVLPHPCSMRSTLYATNDPYLASFVLSQGAVLAGYTRLGPKRVEFRFVADRALHDLLRLYWSGERVPVVPARLFDALRMLKKRSLFRT
jgi:hypothetical protein